MNKCQLRGRFVILSSLIVFFYLNLGWGEERSLLVSPILQFYFADKDTFKFREHYQTSQDITGGLENALFKGPWGEKLNTEIEGRIIMDNNDFNFLLDVANKSDRELFEFQLGYNGFNRYYDNTGGFFQPFTILPSANLNENLILYDGKLSAKAAGTISSLFHADFEYSWHHKKGKFSELNWANVTEGGVTRKIAPSFTKLRENVHDFNLSLQKEINGYELEIEQNLIFLRAKPVRRESDLDATADKVRQAEKLTTTQYGTTLKALKPFLDDRIIGSYVYRLDLSDGIEREDLETYNALGTPVGGGNRRNFFGSKADNDLLHHIWNIQHFFDLGKGFSVNTRGRADYRKRDSDATYERDTTATPDRIIDERTVIDTKTSGFGFGEHISLSYKNIPLFTPFIKGEFEQNFMELDEEQSNVVTASETFFRTTDEELIKYLAVGGFYSYPLRWLKLSAQFSLGHDRDDYKDKRESPIAGGSDKSAFIDELNETTPAVKANLSISPLSWLHTALRYQWTETAFRMKKESLEPLNSYYRAHQYTTVITLMPCNNFNLIETLSFSDVETETPAHLSRFVTLPGNNANYGSVLSAINYQINNKWSIRGDHQITWAKNFENFADTGLPLALDDFFEKLKIEVNWHIRENLTIIPFYGFGRYRIDSRNHIDDYDYHLAAIRVDWSDL